MFKEEFYDGRVQVGMTPEVVMPRDVVTPVLAEGMAQVARNVGGMLSVGMALEDGKHEFEGELALMDIERVATAEVESRLQLADGAEGSFFDANGNFRQVEVANFNAKVNKRLSSVGAGIMNAERRQAMQARAGVAGVKLLDDVAGLWTKVQAQKCRTAWQGAFDAAMAKGDYLTAQRLLKAGVGAGVHGVGTARRGGRRVAARALGDAGRSGKPVRVGGREYTGDNAVLALSNARAPKPKPELKPDAEGRVTMSALDEPTATVAEADDGGSGLLDTAGSVTMAPYGVAAGEAAEREGAEPVADMSAANVTLTGSVIPGVDTAPKPDEGARVDAALDAFADTGEAGGVFQILTRDEQDEVVSSFCETDRMYTLTDYSGRQRVETSAATPEPVERAAAKTEAAGGVMSEEDARSMVAGLVMYYAADDESVTADALTGVFAGSGVYEALGAGDAAVGKLEVHGMVAEYMERARSGTDKVTMATIKRMVDAKLRERGWGNTQWGWREMEDLNPGMEGEQELEDVWDRESDHAVWEKWWALRRKYDWYRKEGRYKPKHEDSDADEEFDENAQDFYDWYMKNEYKPYRENCENGARDWYIGEIVRQLKNRMSEGKDGKPVYGDGKGGYASEIAIAREVLERKPPADMGYEAMRKREEERENETRERMRGRKDSAQPWVAKLRDAKARAKAEEAAAKKREKDEAKAEAERAKREEKERVAVLKQKRRAVRGMSWRWDEREAGRGDCCGVWLPKAVARELVNELEWDDEKEELRVQVGNVSCVVLGLCDGDEYRLNTPAVIKLNGRVKKGAQYAVAGSAHGRFVFGASR